jgi:hypothetical protein
VPLPDSACLPRVRGDVASLLEFIGQQYRGDPEARSAEIYSAMDAILQGPELNDIGWRRRDSGIELRRHNVSQFAIIYAYFEPSPEYPNGFVSFRAVRHSRKKNVFHGVREAPAWLYGMR